MRRHVVVVALSFGALLLSPGATGVPDVPGDPTPPVVTPVIAGTLGDAGWYRSNVTVNWTVVDPESIILSTTGCDARTLTSDTIGTRVTCSAVSDGGETTVTKTFTLDKTAPAASATPSRGADANGWYNHQLSVAFDGVDTTSGLQSCSAPQVYAGPDTGSTSVAGTCRDRAGNTAAPSLSLKYDATSPQAAPAARPADANGWYNHAVTVAFQGADGTSGVETCTQLTYAGPDDPSVSLSGTCRDRAGNESAPSAFTLKYDETAPQASATASRAADVNGWHNRPVTVTFSGSDAMSGLESCDPPSSYSGPDAASATVTGACRDRAGNVAPRSFALKYDATAPSTSATPSRQPNANGWFSAPLTVSFAGTDAMSGIESCAAAKSYAGPDDAAAALSGTCTDKAGNTGAASFPVKYDATAPQTSATPGRVADSNGWYNHALAVAFSGADAVSGVDSCDATKSYAGPDAASATVSGACRDRAGNSTGSSFTLKYDATAPSTSATSSRPPNANGWFNAPVTVSFAGSDAMSTIDSCDAAKSYSGPDAASTAVSGTCRDKAGNAGSASFALKYDATAPSTSATPSRQPNANGWYNAAVAVAFTATDATSGVASCDAAKTYAGPDSASASVSGACRDSAGNSAARSVALAYDASAPQVTGATPARAPNANGWYNAPVALDFRGTDATSGIESCTQLTYGGPDNETASAGGSCGDRAGNQSAASAFVLRYDATGPQVSATPARPADTNGWFNRPVTIGFSGTDATSGVESCDAPTSYSAPDSVGTSVGGACRDKAGNAGSASFAFKYDGTAPQGAASASRAPNGNGWYNAPLTVAFAGTDVVSGLESCDAAKSYSGPDSAAAVVSGTCADKAGNRALVSLALKYDGTPPAAVGAPSRAPDANGWYNRPLSVAFGGTDVTSGVDACTAPQGYAGPDTATVSVTGSCSDRAGNTSSSSTFGFKYDGTAPLVTDATAARPPDRDGWYNRPVAFSARGTDVTAGIETCPGATYAGPERADASVLASCVDRAGNQGTKSLPLKYDATGPQVTAAPSREPDANGWYNRSLTVDFGGADSVSGLASCSAPESYDGPDSVLAVVSGFCLDKAGNAGVASFAVHFDATPPQVAGATPSRLPDANGWYNHPLVVGFQGADSTSEIDACTQTSYAGPDAGAASVRGSCRDRAGNGSPEASFTLRYDGTPPSLTDVRAKAGNHAAVLTWAASADAVIVEILRSGKIVYRGSGRTFADTRLQNGVRYRYTLNAYDEAHNAATHAVAVKPTAPLVSPAAGATITAPVRLAWVAVEKATHYNVQVWRRGKIFSAWPRATSVRLPRSWTYGGRRYRLTPGRYHWYVWPGYGRPSSKKYGPLLGSSSFVVRRG